VVIAIGESRLSTAEVYRRFDSMQIPPVEKTPDFVNALKSNDNDKALEYMSNAFESVTDIICPETKQMRDLLLESGALTSHLSGSGPSVYGLFDNEASAHSSAEFLIKKGFSAYECKILG
jgi:4-diphosphocytidyl-2-C-methyl-D-erythritol kinase